MITVRLCIMMAISSEAVPPFDAMQDLPALDWQSEQEQIFTRIREQVSCISPATLITLFLHLESPDTDPDTQLSGIRRLGRDVVRALRVQVPEIHTEHTVLLTLCVI